MKDSHIGTYGVIGLIMYYLWYASFVSSLSVPVAAAGILVSDAFAKTCAAQITNLLPYARPEGAKNRIKYTRMTAGQLIIVIVAGCLPLALLFHLDIWLPLGAILPVLATAILIVMMRRCLGGYTGDCCGAVCLIDELSMLAGIALIYNFI